MLTILSLYAIRIQVDKFTDHINNIDECIKFTREVENNNCLAFLDSLVTRNLEGSLDLSVYRKPTHTDQYLHFTSHHPLHQKLGVVRTLQHRCDSIVTKSEDKVAERKHLAGALRTCGYPTWSLRTGNRKQPRDRTAIRTGCV